MAIAGGTAKVTMPTSARFSANGVQVAEQWPDSASLGHPLLLAGFSF